MPKKRLPRIRRKWKMKPVTHVKPSKKLYERKREKRIPPEEYE